MKRTLTYHNAGALADGYVSPRQRRLDSLVAAAKPVASAAAGVRRPEPPKLGSRWTRQVAATDCFTCRGRSRRMWRCRALHGRELVLCEDCKQRAFDASFGTLDVAHLAEPSPIESNRQRH